VKPGSTPKIESSCVVTISNYCWCERVRDAALTLVKCEKKDFDISFKLSSTAFATARNAPDAYHFDRNGVKLSYNQCYTLFRSEKFVVEYLGNVRKYYERDQQLLQHSKIEQTQEQQPYNSDEDCDDEEAENVVISEEDKEEEEEEEMLAKKSKNISINRSVIKRLKKL
jgi:hypothetical protein